jgi:hypothetical protein
MLEINVKHNVADAIARLNEIERKHVPFATSLALTRTAQEVRKAEVEEMKRVFDRPTPFTLRSLYLKPATKADLTAKVWFKDLNRPEHYLVPQIRGGERLPKRFEEHLRRAGILPKDQVAVPGGGARLNKYGNMSAGQITQILSALGAHPDPYAHSKRKIRARIGLWRGYFVGRPGGGRFPFGVWEKRGNKLLPVLIFVRRPTYTKLFQFYELGKRIALREFPKQFDLALRQALLGR